MTGAFEGIQTVTVWLEREDGAKFSWAGPITMTKAQHAACKVDPQSIAALLSRRSTWPLYPPTKDVRVISVEIVNRAGHVSLSWTAAGRTGASSEVGGEAPT